MRDKKILMIGGIIAILLLVVNAGAAVTEIPDLVGNWSVSDNEGESFLSDYTNASMNNLNQIIVVVETQNGQTFEGYIETPVMLPNGETVAKEGFAGVISDDMSHAYIQQYTSGISYAELTSPDTMTLYNLFEKGPSGKDNPGVSKLELIREKSE